MPKTRVDQLLVDQGHAASKTEAQRLVLAGLVYHDTKQLDKPGHPIADDTELTVKGREHPWVSRGGLKLQKALEHFSIDVTDMVAIDVGASTGGFTDVLLQSGAARVYAVDVGQGQLAWKLQQDARVVVLYKTNARALTPDQIPEPCDLIVCDASFISLKTVLPASFELVKPAARLVALIKPQFEVGREALSQKPNGGGVVRDPELHRKTCDDIAVWLAASGWRVEGIADSPITGPAGNKEFLVTAVRPA